MPTFYNQATISYNNTIRNSNIVAGNLLEVLTASKMAVHDTYTLGDNITYVVTVTNSGNLAYNDITVSDNLGAYTTQSGTFVPLTYVDGTVNYYINGVLQPTPTVTATPSGLTASGISLPADGAVMLIYEASVNNTAPMAIGDNIVNTVTIYGTGIAEPITATESITPNESADLTISKSLCPSTVTENGQITYTFVIQNTGNTATVATDNVIVTDTFNPVLNNISVTYNDQLLQQNVGYTYNNGLFTTLNGAISVPAAEFVQNPETGVWSVTPGVGVLTVTGTVI